MSFAFEHLTDSTHPVTVFMSIFFYEIICAIFWPTPSEAPMLLYPAYSMIWILLISALGKGLGAYLVCTGYDSLENILKKYKIDKFMKINPKLGKLIIDHGFIAYFFLQAIPFMPMRSAIYLYSYLSRDRRRVAIGAALGTPIRNVLMYFLVWMGYVTASRFK